MVSGYRDSEAYYWNIVRIDGVYYHADFMRGALDAGSDLRLMLDDEMVLYQWDRDAYPACERDTLPEENEAAVDAAGSERAVRTEDEASDENYFAEIEN